MKSNVLFIQGGGDGGFEADEALANSLQKELGASYIVHYPRMPSDKDAPDFGWLQAISNHVDAMDGDIILAGHSLGASMLLKYLSERKVSKRIAGVFLIASPFWKGNEDWVQGLKLKEGFARNMPPDLPVYFYHCRDDEEVPFGDLSRYKQKLPHAVVREIENGGHQLGNDLSSVSTDIRALGK